MRRIYLDHAATTPLDPQVLAAMAPFLGAAFGNPSSLHHEGRTARKGLDDARRTVAAILGATPREIVFTSGGSESDSLAIRGVVAAHPGIPHIVTSSIEHHAVLHTVQALERDGRASATYLPVNRDGLISEHVLTAAIRPDTALISVMYANNETGAIQPVSALARAARRSNPKVTIHTDAVQAAGWLDLDVDRLGVDLLSLTAHKIYGPRGTGALYVRTGVALAAQVLGGNQERGRRAGTENVAGAAGLAAALRLATAGRETETERMRKLREALITGLSAAVSGIAFNGPRELAAVLPGTVNCSFPDLESEALLQYLDLNGIAASSGAACTTGSLEPSHVLLAMGVPERQARNSLRLTLGRDTNMDDVARVIAAVTAFATRVRAQMTSPR